MVVCEDDGEIVEAIDERTLLVPISHVLFKNGEIQDVAAVVRRSHEAGAHVVLDAYQSAGIVPLDVTALDVDFAVGGSVNGSAAGPATAGSTCAPTSPSGSSRRTRDGRRTRPRSPSRRRCGTPGWSALPDGTPNVPALYAATAGYDLIEEIGVERIRANSLRQTELLIRLAESAGLGIASPRDPERRGGTVTVHVDDFPAVRRARRAPDPLRFPPWRRNPDRPALLHLRLSWSTSSIRSARSSRPAPMSATWAPRAA